MIKTESDTKEGSEGESSGEGSVPWPEVTDTLTRWLFVPSSREVLKAPSLNHLVFSFFA